MMHANLRSRHNCPSKVKYIYNWKLGNLLSPTPAPPGSYQNGLSPDLQENIASSENSSPNICWKNSSQCLLFPQN